jgi:hypothetical protein
MSKISTHSILRRSLFSIGSCMALLALTTMPNLAEPSTIAPVPNPVEHPKPNPPLPAYLETLRTAGRIESKFIGLVPKPSKVYQAFEQAIAAGDKIRPEIEQILQSGTPAGKMYAVMLLARFDLEATKQALEVMQNDHSVVVEQGGDVMMIRKVSEWATAWLKGAETQWILLQQQGKQPDRQMQFTRTENLLPIVDQATFSQLLQEPKPTPETLQALAKSRTWQLQLVTVHESALQPGYINARAEVDCDKQQLRIITKTAVSYQQIQSSEDELSKAIDRESRIVYRLLKNRPIATIAASKGEPWQSLTADSPVYQFVCQSRSGFSPINAGGKLPQHLFAYAWQQVWTDGTFPQAVTPPKQKPELSTDLETQ